MRNKERISKFKKLTNNELLKLINKYLLFDVYTQVNSDVIFSEIFFKNIEQFFKYWQKYPDLRFGQAIINFFGLPIGSYKHEFWFKECNEILNSL